MLSALGAISGLPIAQIARLVLQDGRNNSALRLSGKSGREMVKQYSESDILTVFPGLEFGQREVPQQPIQLRSDSQTFVDVLKQHSSVRRVTLDTSAGNHSHLSESSFYQPDMMRISILCDAVPTLTHLTLDNSNGSVLCMYGSELASLVNLTDFTAINIVIHGDLLLGPELKHMTISHCKHQLPDDPADQVLNLSSAKRLKSVSLHDYQVGTILHSADNSAWALEAKDCHSLEWILLEGEGDSQLKSVHISRCNSLHDISGVLGCYLLDLALSEVQGIIMSDLQWKSCPNLLVLELKHSMSLHGSLNLHPLKHLMYVELVDLPFVTCILHGPVQNDLRALTLDSMEGLCFMNLSRAHRLETLCIKGARFKAKLDVTGLKGLETLSICDTHLTAGDVKGLLPSTNMSITRPVCN